MLSNVRALGYRQEVTESISVPHSRVVMKSNLYLDYNSVVSAFLDIS